MFNVKGVTTPTLIQHGEADIRVPISQGYEFYNALKAQNVPVRMIVLPRQPHGPNERKCRSPRCSRISIGSRNISAARVRRRNNAEQN
jgi:dipeptidyl aminopeptidase/acylaminoacyl peptidase